MVTHHADQPAWRPIAATLAATLAAPPSAERCSRTVTTGTGASGESRSVSPIRYRSRMRSPTTTMRRPRILVSRLFQPRAGQSSTGVSRTPAAADAERSLDPPHEIGCGFGQRG